MSIVNQLPADHLDYFTRLTEKAIVYKMIPVASGEDWYPSWPVKGEDCFLVFIKEEFSMVKNKPVSKGTFFLYACGVDDEEMAVRGLDQNQAEELFNQIKGPCSKNELQKLGFVRGG